MVRIGRWLTGVLGVVLVPLGAGVTAACSSSNPPTEAVAATSDDPGPTLDVSSSASAAVSAGDPHVDAGRETFRYEMFGDDFYWGGLLGLHTAIAGNARAGQPGLSPTKALALGLKVDEDALPPELKRNLKRGAVDLDDPANTVTLLKLDAVVGLVGTFEGDRLVRVGVTCALCHSIVDDKFAPGIGDRLDGWPNRDLDVGKIIALAPNLAPVEQALDVDRATLIAVLDSWGPGKYDAELALDGKAFQPDGRSSATLIPAAFGQAGVSLQTYTGWGSTPYWNAFVAITQMHGIGTFRDDRLNDPEKFPLAVKNHLYDLTSETDMVSDKLADLHVYQLSLAPPVRPDLLESGSIQRGKGLFEHKAKCASCHVPPLFTEPGSSLHTGEEIGIDDFQAQRSPTGRYRTTPLRGMAARAKGGYYHDGRFATLTAVVVHYNEALSLGLDRGDIEDLVRYVRDL